MRINIRFIFRVMPILGMLVATFLIFNSAPSQAQEFRSTLTGQVTDPSGAVIPNATVTAVKNDTQQSYTGRTNGAGLYNISYMLPGLYTVTVKAQGFRTFLQEKVLLQAGQGYGLNVKLEVGAATQSVTVTAAPPLIQTTNATGGTVLSARTIENLPLNGRQIFMLIGTTPGSKFLQTQFGSSGFSGTRGWDVTSSYSIGGAANIQGNYNNFQLNGASDTIMTGIGEQGTWMTAPNVDALQETNVMDNLYDARYGESGGGIVNMVTKTGTNAFHGDLYDYLENGALNANTFTNDITGVPKEHQVQNQFGGTFGGPIKKDKIFFFGSYEGYREIIPYTVIQSVPTAAEANGDFTGTGYDIFNPATVACTAPGGTLGDCAGNAYASTAFPGDTIPPADINKSGADIMKLFPMPNIPGAGIENNFVSYAPDLYSYNQPMARLDYTQSPTSRWYAAFEWQGGSEVRNSSGFPGATANGNIDHTRNNTVDTLDFTHTFSPTLIGDFKASFSRFGEFEENGNFAAQTGISSLGLSYPFAGTAAYKNLLPQITFSEIYANSGPTGSALVGNQLTDDIYTNTVFDADFNKTKGRNNIEFGGEYGEYQFANAPGGSPNGMFEFYPNFTQYNPTSRSSLPAGVTGTSGNVLADLLLGDPGDTGIGDGCSGNCGVAWNTSFQEGFPLWAVYGQDNIRVTHRLTVNIGLRYSVQRGVRARYNNGNRGMCLSCVNTSVTSNPTYQANVAGDAAAWSTYTSALNAAVPGAAGITSSAFSQALGYIQFANVNGQSRDFYNTDWSNIGPRLGFAYMIDPKTVVRGGWGWLYGYGIESGTTTGFEYTTPYQNTLNGVTPVNYFAEGTPFPNGILQPTGASLGEATAIGQQSSLDFPERRMPRIQVMSLGVQRALPGHMVLDVKYAGNYGRNLRDFLWLNGTLPLSRGYPELQQTTYNPAVASLYTEQVPNPYYGVVPVTTQMGGSPTVSAQNLMVPDSLFNLVGDYTAPDGKSWYDSLQVKLDKRLFGATRGLSLQVAYTYEKATQSDGYRNGWPWQDAKQIYEVQSDDETNVLTWTGVWDLPWGQGAKYLAPNPGKALGYLINNWRFGWVFSEATGLPVSDPGNWYLSTHSFTPNGGPTFGQWIYNCNGVPESCYESIPSDGQGNQPDRIPYLRMYSVPDLDIDLEKNIPILESKTLQFRVDMFNMSNTPYFGSLQTNPFSNGGKITQSSDGSWNGFGTVPFTQYNFSRIIQLSLKFLF
jgi:hypothetical protein